MGLFSKMEKMLGFGGGDVADAPISNAKMGLTERRGNETGDIRENPSLDEKVAEVVQDLQSKVDS